MGALGEIRTLLVVLLLCTAVRTTASSAPADSLKNHVTIYRDEYGVPHILGDSEPATFYGFGYAQAEDHLERMMLEFRDAQGRRSEVLGRAALGDEGIAYQAKNYRWDGDYLQRLLRTKQAVTENRQKIDPTVYQILDAFAQGVNCFIAEHRGKIPDWIDGVTAEDVEALERSYYMRYYSVDAGMSKLHGKSIPLPDMGSNHWAIAPEKSATGQVMHVEHVHMPWANRFQLYEAHLITPGKLDVAGIGWFGSPFFLIGFNTHITWSVSYNQPNISDVYEEAINPANSLQYLYEGHWRDIHKETATFRVKVLDGVWTTVTLPLHYTHHGPIVEFNRVRHTAYAIKLPNFDGVNYSTGQYLLMKANGIPEFKEALSRQLILRWNLLCTDSKHIYWVHNGVVPRRDPGFNWLSPVPGWTKRTEWQGYLPFSANPQLLDPAAGFLQNANNPPWVATRNSGLKPLDPAPYYLSYKAQANAGEEVLNTRGERLFGVLTRPNERFTLAQMVSLGYDTYVLAADVAVPLLDRAAATHQDADRALKRAVVQLKSWDRRSAVDSVAFTYLFYWAEAYRDLYGDSASRFNSYGRGNINIDSAWEQHRAWQALCEALARIQKTFGKQEVRWGEINLVIRGGSFRLGGTGAFGVLHPDEGVRQPDGQIYCDDGWGHLMAVVEGEPKQIWSLLPFGESEHPDSPHYNDQAKLHSRKELKRFWFTRSEILQNAVATWGERNRILRSSF